MEQNEITENQIVEETEQNTVVDDVSLVEQLEQIHTDLGVITCFIIFFVVVILLKYAYKYFDMIFKS